METDNKNILLYRKIILLSLGLITCLRWCRGDIETAITRILEACKFKGFFRMCRAKGRHAYLLGRSFSSYHCYQNNSSYRECRHCYLQLGSQHAEMSFLCSAIHPVTWPSSLIPPSPCLSTCNHHQDLWIFPSIISHCWCFGSTPFSS